MIAEEYIETARKFIEESDSYFAKGDVLQGSEKTWGAAAHIVMAAAQRRGWDFGTHRALKVAVRRLVEERDDQFLDVGFLAAEKFHANFYHKFMEDFEYEEDRPKVRLFVQKVDALIEQEENGQNAD